MQALAEKGLSLEGAVNQTGVNPKISTIMKESLNKVQFSGLSVGWPKLCYFVKFILILYVFRAWWTSVIEIIKTLQQETTL